MDDVLGVAVDQGPGERGNVGRGPLLVKVPALLQLLVQLPPRGKLQDQVHAGLVVKVAVQPQDIRVPEVGLDLDLPPELVLHVVVLQLVLEEDLERNNVSGLPLPGEVDVSELSPAQGPSYVEVFELPAPCLGALGGARVGRRGLGLGTGLDLHASNSSVLLRVDPPAAAHGRQGRVRGPGLERLPRWRRSHRLLRSLPQHRAAGVLHQPYLVGPGRGPTRVNALHGCDVLLGGHGVGIYGLMMSKGLAADAAAACETLSERERKTKQKRTLNPLPCCVPSRFFTHEKTQFRGGGGRCERSGSTSAIWRFAPAVLRVQGLASPWLRHACVLRQRSLLLRAARVTAARFLCLRAFRSVVWSRLNSILIE